MLAGKFQKAITGLGMERLEHPLFYHAPVGIRFEIGGEEPIYNNRFIFLISYLLSTGHSESVFRYSE